MQYVRYWSTYYNCDFSATNSYSFDTDDYIDNLPPIERGRKYALYYSGRQENINYNHMTQDISGNTLQSVWIKGKKIHGLINHLAGTLTQMMSAKEISVLNLSPDVQNKKTRLFNQLMFRYSSQGMQLFNELQAQGVSFDPMPGQAFDGPESIEKFMEYDWKEEGQITGTYVARDVEERNMSNSMYVQSFLNYCAANYCGVYNYVENGVVYQENVPFWNLVFVPGDDEDPYNRNTRAVGFYKQMTPQEVLSKWGDQLSPDAIEKIKSFRNKGSFDGMDSYNNEYITYFNPENRTINVLTMFWIGEHDLRYEQKISEDGEVTYSKNKRKFKDKRSEYIVPDVMRCTLIGNIDAVDYGYDTNVVRTIQTNMQPELPIKVLTGRTLFQSGVSIIGKVAQNQDKIDALRYKITELVSRAKGRVYVINGDTQDVPTSEFVSDLSTMGIHVRKPSGNASDMVDNKRMAEVLDWTLDPNIGMLRDLYLEEERIIEEAMSVSKIALGMQGNVVGKAVQQNSIARSTLGLATIYEDFVRFNEFNLQYCLNLSKLALTAEGDQDHLFMVGDRQVKWMKVTRDFAYQDLLLYVKVKDVIDEGAKARLQQYAFAYMQNPEAGNTILDVLKLEQATTWTQAINELEYAIKKRNKMAAIAAQQQAQMQMQMQNNELQQDMAKAAMKENQANQRTMIQADASLEKEQMRNNANKELAEESQEVE